MSNATLETANVLLTNVPRPVLDGLSALASIEEKSRVAYIRDVLSGHVEAAAEVVRLLMADRADVVE